MIRLHARLFVNSTCSMLTRIGETWCTLFPIRCQSGGDQLATVKEVCRENGHYSISYDEFKWVERLKPIELVPELPKQHFPTPSGWSPPADPPPNLPYRVGRTRFHLFPIYSEVRRDRLNPETMEFSYVELIVLKNIEGDVFACQKDLKTFLERLKNCPVALHVNEPQGKIRIKGVEKGDIEQFLVENGF